MVPTVALAVAAPSVPPLHLILVVATELATNAAGSVMVTLVVVVQELASDLFTV